MTVCLRQLYRSPLHGTAHLAGHGSRQASAKQLSMPVARQSWFLTASNSKECAAGADGGAYTGLVVSASLTVGPVLVTH